jgi:HK97 family phage portal protein
LPESAPPKPGLLSRVAAGLMGALEAKAAPALAYRHSGRGGSGYSSGAWWGDGRSSLVIGMPGDDRDVAADAGDVWLNSAVAACVSWLTDQFSAPFLEVLSLDRKTGDYTPHPTHDLIDLLEDPNPGYGADALWAATVISYQVSGNAYWIKARAKSGKVLQLWHCAHWEIEPVWPDDGSEFIGGYVQTIDGVKYPLAREDVVHFRCGLDPSNPRLGLSPLGAVLREVATDNAAAAYEAAILRNMGIVPTFVQPAEKGDQLGQGEADVIREQFQGQTTGGSRGRLVVSTARIDIKQFGLSPKDMSLGSVRYIPEDRICAATGVNAQAAGLSSGSAHKTYNNYAESIRAAYNRGLNPMQGRFARSLTTGLLIPDFGGRPGLDYCEWNYDEVAALSEDADARATRAALLYKEGIVKLGEACEIAGCKPPDPEFDTYKVSGAVQQAVAMADAQDDGRINDSARGDAPAGGKTPVGDPPDDATAGTADDPPIPRLRIAKALAKVDAARNGHASASEREDGTDPFGRIAAQVMSLAAPAPAGRPTEIKAADDEPEPWSGDDESDDAPDESNTYGLPTGKPIADEIRRWFEAQLRDVLGTVRTIGADLGDPAAWAAGVVPAIPTGLDAYDRPMAEAMTPLIGAYWDESGRRTMARVGLDPDDWRVVDPHTRGMIERAALAFSRSTNETTTKDLRGALDALREELGAGIVDAGETLPQLTKRVQSVFENASKNRAKVIAETEASRAVHAAQLESARQSGVVYGSKLLLSSDACQICKDVLASMPEGGWPLGDTWHDDGKGHPEYSTIVHPPIHPRCRCAMTSVLLEDAPAHVARPDYGSVFDVPADEPAAAAEPALDLSDPIAVARYEGRAPRGRPVGDALTLPKGDMGKRLRVTIEAIAMVHGDGELPVIPVVKNAASKANGAYERTYDGTPVRITISSKGGHPEETFAHEIGHFLEKTVIPGHARGRRPWKADPLFAAWSAAINESAATKSLRDLASKVTVDRVTSDGRAVRYKVDGRYLAYGLSPDELWARSYSQYIATRSGDPELMAGIDMMRDPDRLYRDFHWSDEDFAPIAAAIDELFKSLGWIG